MAPIGTSASPGKPEIRVLAIVAWSKLLSAGMSESTLSRRDLASAPKDWMLGPVWLPRQDSPRQVKVGDNLWHMGVSSISERPSEPIDMSHVITLLGVLSFYQGNNPVACSMSELARRIASSRGGRYFRDLRRRLETLRNFWIRLERPDGEQLLFAALHAVALRTTAPRRRDSKTDQELWLDEVVLHREFVILLDDFANVSLLRLDALRSLGSKTAQSIYLFLPSRAAHHDEEQPWEISLKTLFSQLGLPCPSAKSKRKERLTKGHVVAQLDGAPTLYGHLRVKLAPTKDLSDFKLQCWIEPDTKAELFAAGRLTQSPLLAAWRRRGGTDEEFTSRMRDLPELDSYEEDKLKIIGVSNTQRFHRMAKALLRGQFTKIVAELASEITEGRAPSSPWKVLSWRLIKAVETLPGGKRRELPA